MTNYTGTSGDDTQAGTSGDDLFDYSQGGHDTLTGGGGSDNYLFGASFGPGDRVVGSDGSDIVNLYGDYAKTVFTDDMMVKVDILYLTGPFRYILTLANENASAPDFQVKFDADVTGRINASKVHDYGIQFVSSASGGLVLRGGDQSDNFLFYNGMERTLVIDGGGGEQNFVSCYGTAHIHFADHSFVNIGGLLVSGDTRLTFADGNIAAGKTLNITDQSTAEFDNRIDGHKELDGAFNAVMGAGDDTIIGGHGNDTLRGMGGDDRIIGGQGQDELYGDVGADTFAFLNAGDSRRGAADLILDLQDGDAIDLSHIDANVNAVGRQHFQKVGAFTHHAGELTVAFDAAQNHTIVRGDIDGDGKAEFELHIYGDHTAFTGYVL